MVKHGLRGLTESNGTGSKTDETAERQKRTTTEMEQKVTRILKLMKNKDHGKRGGAKKESEVSSLVEDLYKNYQAIYEQYDHLREETKRIANSKKHKEDISSSNSSSDSDSEYYSSEEIDPNNNINDQSSNLHFHTNELEEQILRRNQVLLAKVDSLRRELDHVRNQKRELENRKNQEISENVILIGNLREELAAKIAAEKRIVEEKDEALAQIKDQEIEVDSLNRRKSEVEEQNKRLHTRNSELEVSLTSKDKEIKNLKQKVDSVQVEKKQLGQEKEGYRQEFSRRLSEIETENNKLKSKIEDQERIVKEKNKIISTLPNIASSLIVAERKINELAEEHRSNLEDKIRILSQRILVAEQLHTESRENYRARNKKCEQEKKQLEKKITIYESEVKKLSNMNEFAAERMTRKFEEESGKILNHISWMTKELTFAKFWVRNRNSEVRQLKTKLIRFVAQMDEKEEHEFLLREKLWNLEAKISKEGGEKLNLIRTLGQFEKKTGKMENMMKEKDEEIMRMAEEKREAIRQLCVVIEHYRSQYDYLKEAMIGKKVRNRRIV